MYAPRLPLKPELALVIFVPGAKGKISSNLQYRTARTDHGFPCPGWDIPEGTSHTLLNVSYWARWVFFYAKRSSWLNSQWRGKGAVENRDFPTRDYIRQTNASCSAMVSGPSWQPIILYPTFGLGNKINLARQNSGFPLTTPNHSGGTLPQLLTDFFFHFLHFLWQAHITQTSGVWPSSWMVIRCLRCHDAIVITTGFVKSSPAL